MFRPWQLRAIRAGIDWSQGQLAKKAGLAQSTISDLEKGEIDSPGTKAIEAIEIACQSRGFYFTRNGIEERTSATYEIEGEDCYLRLLKIAQTKLSAGDYFQKTNTDERRSSPAVIAQLQEMRNAGILFQSLIRPNDTHVMGELEEYRWFDNNIHARGDVKVIFGDCVAYLISWEIPPKIIVVQGEFIAAEARSTFGHIWHASEQVNESSAPVRFDGASHG